MNIVRNVLKGSRSWCPDPDRDERRRGRDGQRDGHAQHEALVPLARPLVVVARLPARQLLDDLQPVPLLEELRHGRHARGGDQNQTNHGQGVDASPAIIARTTADARRGFGTLSGSRGFGTLSGSRGFGTLSGSQGYGM